MSRPRLTSAQMRQMADQRTTRVDEIRAAAEALMARGMGRDAAYQCAAHEIEIDNRGDDQ